MSQYVTAFVFLSIEAMEQCYHWKRLALGPKWDDGVVGGSLKHAIDQDKADSAVEHQFERVAVPDARRGLAIENQDDWHDDYGNTRIWY